MDTVKVVTRIWLLRCLHRGSDHDSLRWTARHEQCNSACQSVSRSCYEIAGLFHHSKAEHRSYWITHAWPKGAWPTREHISVGRGLD